MRDLLGNKVKVGDILLELGRGWSFDDSGFEYHLKIWQKPSGNDDYGFEYSIDGKKHKFWTADVEDSVKIDMSIMPDGFEFSFKHGMSNIASKIEEGTALELIENSNWKQHEVTKEQVERFKFMQSLKIEKLEDIFSNIEELKKDGYVPHEIVSKVLELTGVRRTLVNNGEIGMAWVCDQVHYQDIIKNISKTKSLKSLK